MKRLFLGFAAVTLAACGAAAEPPPSAPQVVAVPAPAPVVPESLLAKLPVELRPVALDALAGRIEPRPFADGAAWDASIPALRRTKGDAAAWMEVMPAAMTLGAPGPCPDLPNACALFQEARTLMNTEPAIRAYLIIVRAEQHGDPADAVRAMQAASHSPLGNHPTLLASYALALDAGGAAMVAAARGAGLPVDADALHVRAIRAYPYNPLYWTDAGDAHGRRGNLKKAVAFYLVALHLPSPGARPGSRLPPLQAKADLLEQLRGRTLGAAPLAGNPP